MFTGTTIIVQTLNFNNDKSLIIYECCNKVKYSYLLPVYFVRYTMMLKVFIRLKQLLVTVEAYQIETLTGNLVTVETYRVETLTSFCGNHVFFFVFFYFSLNTIF